MPCRRAGYSCISRLVHESTNRPVVFTCANDKWSGQVVAWSHDLIRPLPRDVRSVVGGRETRARLPRGVMRCIRRAYRMSGVGIAHEHDARYRLGPVWAAHLRGLIDRKEMRKETDGGSDHHQDVPYGYTESVRVSHRSPFPSFFFLFCFPPGTSFEPPTTMPIETQQSRYQPCFLSPSRVYSAQRGASRKASKEAGMQGGVDRLSVAAVRHFLTFVLLYVVVIDCPIDVAQIPPSIVAW